MLLKLLPTIFCAIAVALSGATHPSLPESKNVESVIIGGGVGGSTAAIYLARAGLHPQVIEKSFAGSSIAQSDAVENWPGALKIRGVELMENIHKQAELSGAQFINQEVVSVDFSKRPFAVAMRSDSGEIQTIFAKTCIIATGSTPNALHIAGERQYWGRGISNCAICDGSLYRGKKVGIVGGGDAAILEALYLSNIAKDVAVFVRKDQFKALDAKKKETLLALPNVKVHFETSVKEIKGNDDGVTSVTLTTHNRGDTDYPLDALFLAIGATPNTAIFKDQIALDEHGYIVLKKGQMSSVDGVYAIGDVVDPYYKQAISAAGDGAKAALAIIQGNLATTPGLDVAKTDVKSQSSEPQVIEITSLSQFEKELQSSGIPVIVDFYATWCSPCKRLAPKLESTASRLTGKYKFLKVNVDQLDDLTTKYKIRAMPTVLYINQKGIVVDRKVGEPAIGELLTQLTE